MKFILDRPEADVLVAVINEFGETPYKSLMNIIDEYGIDEKK